MENFMFWGMFIACLLISAMTFYIMYSQAMVNRDLEEKRPMLIYKADNQGAEIKGRVLQKEKIGDLHTITIKNYGIFVVTKEVYDTVKVGDEVKI